MTPVDLGHLDRHRAVEVHRERWHPPGSLEAMQHPEELLRPIHGERGHDDHAAVLRRVVNDARQIFLCSGWMGTVAVGRLEQQHVGGGDGLRIAQDGPVVATEIAREHEPHGTHGELRSEEHTSELQSLAYLVCRLLLEKKKKKLKTIK